MLFVITKFIEILTHSNRIKNSKNRFISNIDGVPLKNAGAILFPISSIYKSKINWYTA